MAIKKKNHQRRFFSDLELQKFIDECEEIDKGYPDGLQKDKNRIQINGLKERLRKGK